jgi:hypothetical protein
VRHYFDKAFDNRAKIASFLLLLLLLLLVSPFFSFRFLTALVSNSAGNNREKVEELSEEALNNWFIDSSPFLIPPIIHTRENRSGGKRDTASSSIV